MKNIPLAGFPLRSEVEKKFEEDFDEQVGTLIEKDFPAALKMSVPKFIKFLAPLKEAGIDYCSGKSKNLKRLKWGDSLLIEIPPRIFPFFIAIPRKILSLQKQMALCGVSAPGNKNLMESDFFQIRDADIDDKKAENSKPYLVVGVEDGKETIGFSAEACVRQFEIIGWSGLRAEEGIALITHFPKTLDNHSVYLTGSRVDTRSESWQSWRGGFPCYLHKDTLGRLNFLCAFDGGTRFRKDFGTPSLNQRIYSLQDRKKRVKI